MLLAHGGAGGPVFEALILALPLVVLGVVLFVQKTAKPVVSVVLVGTGIAIAVGGMTIFAEDEHEAKASTPSENPTYVSAVTGLCEAERLAGSDPEEAARVFEDRVHVPLHDLAADVEGMDRAAAAALLEAKETVESDVNDEEIEGDLLREHLAGLLETTISGLDAIEVEAPTC